MNNDLISREALYNEVDTWGCNDYDKYDFLDAIDNAPTVTPDKIQAIMSDYLVYRCEPQRPQGEWNYEQVAFYGICSNCGVAVTSNLADIFLYEKIGKCPYNTNFCPNCGADMRGDKNGKS